MALTKNLFFPVFSWCTKTVTDEFSRVFSFQFCVLFFGKWAGVLMGEYYEAGAGLQESKSQCCELMRTRLCFIYIYIYIYMDV